MDKFLIKGPCRVKGKVKISGAKNSALALLAATLLFEKPVTLKNLPRVRDINTMLNLGASATGAVGIYDRKDDAVLKLKTLKAGQNIVLTTDHNHIMITSTASGGGGGGQEIPVIFPNSPSVTGVSIGSPVPIPIFATVSGG